MPEKIRLHAENIGYRQRLDDYLSGRVGFVSKLFLKNLLLADAVSVNDDTQKGGYHLKSGDVITLEIELSADTAMKPEHIDIPVVYEDAALLVVDKPAGMLVHPTLGVKSGTLLNALSFYLNKNYFEFLKNYGAQRAIDDELNFIRPGLIHRLDRQTSGLMVIAKTAEAHRLISRQIQQKRVEKKYIAVADGVIAVDDGIINAPISHDQEQKLRSISDTGKSAESLFRVIERRADSTLLELEPVTGRTNQLRLHLAHIGHPIIGDALYGGRDFSRLCLHAWRLVFQHPTDKKATEFESPPPAEFG